MTSHYGNSAESWARAELKLAQFQLDLMRLNLGVARDSGIETGEYVAAERRAATQLIEAAPVN